MAERRPGDRMPGDRMRENLALLGALLAVGFATAGIYLIVTKNESTQARQRMDASPRSLIADPEFYEGHQVRLSTAGMELRAPNELIWRARTDVAPTVVCVLMPEARITPETTPAYVLGVCVGVHDGAVTLVQCVPCK